MESLYPDKAAAIARTRVAELGQVADRAVTMCPLCLVNLGKAADGDVAVTDISRYLVEAYGRPVGSTAPPSPASRIREPRGA